MDWNNLKNRECPKCGYRLSEEDGGFECENSDCNFFITKSKMNELAGKFDRDAAKKDMEGYGF